MLVLALLCGLGVGFFSAFLGVGGAPVMVPFLTFVAGLSQHLAEGTTLAVIIPTALVGALAHFRRGFVSLSAAAMLGAGGIAGAILGAQLALRIEAALLRDAFGVFLLVFGASLVLRPGGQRSE